MSTVKGYAVEDRAGTLLINTVTGAERATKISYLIVECRVPTYKEYDNVEIEWMFNEACEFHGTRLVEVSISQAGDEARKQDEAAVDRLIEAAKEAQSYRFWAYSEKADEALARARAEVLRIIRKP